MFRRLMIANRGEVAVRIARTCRRLGVETVGVYSEADAGAPWLDVFDLAVCIGPGHPARSYLDQDAILQAAVQTGCSALHPGWGFLAEDPLLARMCGQFGVTFVGPPPGVMRTMAESTPGTGRNALRPTLNSFSTLATLRTPMDRAP